MEAQKVKANGALVGMEGVGNSRFTWFQFQSDLGEPVGHGLLDLFDYGEVRVQDDQVISVANDLGLGILLGDGFFQTV
ncbi:MAG TPA: hypothetical protein PKD98_02330 [Anaerolineae bacterium]|nr:hypothetical protein [Anaerolineae bacterium]